MNNGSTIDHERVVQGPSNLDTLRSVTTCQRCLSGLHHSIAAVLVQCPVCTHVNALIPATTTQPSTRYTTSIFNEFINYDEEELIEMLAQIEGSLMTDEAADVIQATRITGQRFLTMTVEDWRHAFTQFNCEQIDQTQTSMADNTNNKNINNTIVVTQLDQQRESLIASLLVTAKLIIANFSSQAITVPFTGELYDDTNFDDRSHAMLVEDGVLINNGQYLVPNNHNCPPALRQQLLPSHFSLLGTTPRAPAVGDYDDRWQSAAKIQEAVAAEQAIQQQQVYIDAQVQARLGPQQHSPSLTTQSTTTHLYNRPDLSLYPKRFEPEYQNNILPNQ